MTEQQAQQPQVLNAHFVSERGRWQRNLIALLLGAIVLLQFAGLNETNENETRSRNGRPLICGLAYDDALATPAVAIAYRNAGCEEAFTPLPED